MKLSARNQLKGKVVKVQKGQTTSHIQIDIGKGVIVPGDRHGSRGVRDVATITVK
jgi:ABC-type molybdate transport system ATPase subunit